MQTNNKQPKIVCLCGSTKFKDAFIKTNFEETMRGNIVLTVGWFGHADGFSYSKNSNEKRRADWLHFEKIKIADEVLFLNVNGYMGLSTCDEYGCALAYGKKIRFLNEVKEEQK